MRILFLVIFSVFSMNSATLFIGFDTTASSLSPRFFDCAAGRINYNQNGFAIIPYVPTADFAGQVIQAKVAGFLEVHLLVDPDLISLLPNSQSVANSIFSSLRYSGTGISGVWLKVSSYGSTWTNFTQNNQLITTLLSSIKGVMQQYLGDVVIGVYTTYNDWKAVTGGDKNTAASGYLYWSQLGDTVNCGDTFFGFNGCYLQQIQINNFACISAMNIDVKRIV